MRSAIILGIAVLAVIVAAVTSYAYTMEAPLSDKLSITRYWKFSSVADLDAFKQLMINKTSNALVPASGTYVLFSVSNNELVIKDLNTTDSYMPVLGLPSTDHMYVLYRVSGAITVAAINWNETSGSYNVIASIDVSPYSAAVAVLPLPSEVIFYIDGMKLKMNATGYNLIAVMPKSAEVRIDDIAEAAINLNVSLSAPFSGTTVSGNDERDIVVHGTGTLKVWFWDQHQGGDADLFIFKSTNPSYSEASHTKSWDWLSTYSDYEIFADSGPQQTSLNINGGAKLIVKFYSGSTSWEVTYTVLSSSTNTNTNTLTTTSTPTTTDHPSSPIAPPVSPVWLIGLGAIVIFILVIAIVVRR